VAEAAKQNIAVNDYLATALVYASPRAITYIVDTKNFAQGKNSNRKTTYSVKK